jgi:hypothetical protein
MAPPEDLHSLVLAKAFSSLLASPAKLLCLTADRRQLALNRSVLALFSPVLRSALAGAGTEPATVCLPDTTADTLMRLEDLLTSGSCPAFPSLADSRAVLEAADLLGIPLHGLQHGGDSGPAVRLNVGANLDPSVKAMFHAERKKGKRILLVSEDISNKRSTSENSATKESTQRGPKSTRKEQVAPPVQVKKEPVAEEETREEKIDEPTNVAKKDGEQPQEPADDQKHKCEKCNKGFQSVTLLRYHYCSHFRGMLKKKYSNLFAGNKCLDCDKTFSNAGRLLLHIGVQHDKINEVLNCTVVYVLYIFFLLKICRLK